MAGPFQILAESLNENRNVFRVYISIKLTNKTFGKCPKRGCARKVSEGRTKVECNNMVSANKLMKSESLKTKIYIAEHLSQKRVSKVGGGENEGLISRMY